MEGTSGAAFGARGRSTWAMLFVRDGDGVPVSVVSGDVSQPQVAARRDDAREVGGAWQRLFGGGIWAELRLWGGGQWTGPPFEIGRRRRLGPCASGRGRIKVPGTSAPVEGVGVAGVRPSCPFITAVARELVGEAAAVVAAGAAL